jgi:thiol-disulfide isomerase/thioredoxin
MHPIPFNTASQLVKFKQRRQWLAWLVGLGLAGLCGQASAQFEKSLWSLPAQTPKLLGADQNGKVWDLSALKGRPVLLNFWATWCPPCREELPSLQLLADMHGADVVVLTIDVNEPAHRGWRFAKASGFSFPVIPDPKGLLAQRFNVNVFPTTLLLPSKGTSGWKILGAVDWSDARSERWIQQLK